MREGLPASSVASVPRPVAERGGRHDNEDESEDEDSPRFITIA